MSSLSGQELRELARRQRAVAEAELHRLDATRVEHERTEQEVRAALDGAWQHLLGLLLPNLDPAALSAAASRLSLPTLAPGEVAKRAGERKAQLEITRASIEVDQRFVTRAAALNRISIRAHDLAEHITALATSRSLLEGEPFFAELIAEKYGVEGYTRMWWESSYYRHWKHGDLILERHGPRLRAMDFGQIRAGYLREGEALEALNTERGDLINQAGQIEALARRYEEAGTALASTEPWSLATARGRARDHLDALPEQDFLGVFSDDPALSLAAKRVAGVQAKTRYLAAIGEEWIRRPRAEVTRMLEKLARTEEKLTASARKCNASYDEREVRAKYSLPLVRWDDRRARYQQACQSVVGFDAYQVCEPSRDYLWWDLMTGGRVKGNFIPEVAEHRTAHAIRDREVAAGAIATAQGSRDDFSSMDAS